MSEVVFDATEIYRLGSQMAAGAPIIAKHCRYGMDRATAQILHDAVGAVPVDQGHLRRSLTRDVTPFLSTVGTNLVYARAVEFGLQPQQAFPPPGSLLGWMTRHNIPQEAEFAIRRKIYLKGTTAQPYLIPAMERNLRDFHREMAIAAQRAVEEITARRG